MAVAQGGLPEGMVFRITVIPPLGDECTIQYVLTQVKDRRGDGHASTRNYQQVCKAFQVRPARATLVPMVTFMFDGNADLEMVAKLRGFGR